MIEGKKAEQKKEVSCLALTFYYEYLKQMNVPVSTIQDNTEYSRDYLSNRLNWIDWETFCKIEKRIEEVFENDKDIHYKIGRSLGTSEGFGFVRVIIRSFVSPYYIYKRFPKVVKEYLFPFITIRVNRLGNSKVRSEYIFDTKYVVSDAFLETVRGMLSSIPSLLGEPEAKVSYKRMDKNVVIYEISMSKFWKGPLYFIKRVKERVSQTYRLWKRTKSDTAAELEETNRLLRDKVDALTDTEKALDSKVKNLTLINELYSETSKNLELKRMTDDAVRVISRRFGDAFVAIVTLQGNGEEMVVSFSGSQHKGTTLKINEKEYVRELVEKFCYQECSTVTIGEKRMLVTVLKGRRELKGILIMETVGEDYDRDCIVTIKKQLEVSMENALYLKMVEEFNEKLERRVKERTTELELTRDKLEHTVKNLETANEAKMSFLTNISHEIKTPLTLIFSPLDEIEKRMDDTMNAYTNELIQTIRRNTQYLLTYVNELIEFTRIDSRKMPFSPEQLNMDEIIRDVTTRLEPLASRKAISIEFENTCEDDKIDGDHKLITRAFLNILANAIKYTRKEDRIKITMEKEKGWINVSIEDHGPGIPKEQIKYIFERFRRIEQKSDIVDGSGIGLAMVKEIVEMHKGRIRVNSKIESGTTFSVKLPAESRLERFHGNSHSESDFDSMKMYFSSIAEVVGDEESETDDEGLEKTYSKVLVVEDNDEMRKYLKRMLSKHYKVCTSKNGAEGIMAARREYPDLIVTDVMMPVVDGYEMSQRLKEMPETQNIPILVLTACHGIDEVVKGFSCGIEDFVMKPFSSKELLARIDVQLRLRKLTNCLINAEKRAAIGTLSAGIAHEVINPINAILNSVKLVSEHVDEGTALFGKDEVIPQLLEIIELSGKRINDTVTAILTFARQENSDIAIERMDLNDAIDSILKILKYKCKDNIVIHKDIRLKNGIQCYPSMLNQAIMNVVANSLDAITKEGGNIWIEAEIVCGKVYISIRDDGPGIATKMKEIVFNPFFTTKPPNVGTGLGLAITREIVAHHKGTIECMSGNGVGAEFLITIPYVS